MNDLLSRTIDTYSPKVNKKITNGSAEEVLRTFPDFLDTIFKNAMNRLNPSVQLEYLGYRRVSPEEDYKKNYQKWLDGQQMGKSNAIYDLAGSDVYPIELRFTYMGVAMNRLLYLPFANKGNLLTISDTKYNIVPVLSDNVISPSSKSIFIRLLIDKITFNSKHKNFIVNGIKIPGEVIHSPILRTNTKKLKDNIGKPLVATSLYLAAVYGLRGALIKYSKLEHNDIIITNKDVDKYRNEFDVYESTKLKPRGLLVTGYLGHNIKICIRKSKVNSDNKDFIKNYIFGIIYTLDLQPEYENDVMLMLDKSNETMFWKVMLGRVTFKNAYSVERMLSLIEEHIGLLEYYIDDYIRMKLQQTNIIIDDFFDLLHYILKNFNILTRNSIYYNSDINNRYIDMTYYLLFDIISGFNRVIMNLNKRAAKKANLDNKNLTENEVKTTFKDELSPKKIFRLVKAAAMNLAMSVASTSSDNMYTKLTVMLEDRNWSSLNVSNCGNTLRAS